MDKHPAIKELSAKELLNYCSEIKHAADFPFPTLQTIIGSDDLESLCLTYCFRDCRREVYPQLLVRASLESREKPEIESLAEIFPAADWLERECFDMFGIIFLNHPNLKRLLCPDDWQGYPLRKDYMAAKSYQGLRLFPDAKMNFPDRLFSAPGSEIDE